MRKQFAVLGLGSFGRSVALTLESMGCDVIVVDKSQETIPLSHRKMFCCKFPQLLRYHTSLSSPFIYSIT